MGSVLAILAVGLGGLIALWAVGVTVYLVGAKIRTVKDAHEHVAHRASIWGWGLIYTIAALMVLFLLVRFVKFAWEFGA